MLAISSFHSIKWLEVLLLSLDGMLVQDYIHWYNLHTLVDRDNKIMKQSFLSKETETRTQTTGEVNGEIRDLLRQPIKDLV